MKLIQASVRSFRRLENVLVDFEKSETVFVGPNNSGKTSAADIFRLFLKSGDFTIHDFSVSQVLKFDDYGYGKIDEESLPHIELDLWFSLDPDTEFGRVSVLLPDTEQDYDNVGLRLRYMISDAEKLKADYLARFAPQAGGTPPKPLSHYLSLPGTFKQHFTVAYYALEGSCDGSISRSLTPEVGKRVLKSLVRVEFVDAQRKFDDYEQAGSTRLSKVFTGFYKRHLLQAKMADAANELIDKHNEDLTGHYTTVFADLLKVIQDFGVPSVNDRSLRVISSLVPETVLQSNTTLTYRDDMRNHDLPEKYNGLGFKNLIYLAVQICEFHLNWIHTDEDRPLSLILFVEEPEVHLHAQAQQTFIANAWHIIKKESKRCNEENKIPQIVVTTHSSHILDTVDFAHVRYFRRSPCEGEDLAKTTTLNASTVLNLGRFNPSAGCSGVENPEVSHDSEASRGEVGEDEHSDDMHDTLDFLKRYLKLTHCDLFFADAAILVEGTVERLLVPAMIEKDASGLRQRYLTVLEVGGAYAHRFAGLFEFLSVPYLVITDIDSVDPTNNSSACRADTPGAISSNKAIEFFLAKTSVNDLVRLDPKNQQVEARKCHIAYQRPSIVDGYGDTRPMHGRTLEETFAYENIKLFREGSLRLGKGLPAEQDFEAEYNAIYEAVKSATFKKTEFALSVASCKDAWITPKYIADGLKWLAKELRVTSLNT
jgi:predicted ATP-dependent endonuclease of OLD family